MFQVAELVSGDGATNVCDAKTLVDCLIEILILKKWLQGRSNAEFKVAPDAKSVSVIVENKTLVINYFAYLGFNKRTSILPTIVSRKSVPFEGDLLGEEAHR